MATVISFLKHLFNSLAHFSIELLGFSFFSFLWLVGPVSLSCICLQEKLWKTLAWSRRFSCVFTDSKVLSCTDFPVSWLNGGSALLIVSELFYNSVHCTCLMAMPSVFGKTCDSFLPPIYKLLINSSLRSWSKYINVVLWILLWTGRSTSINESNKNSAMCSFHIYMRVTLMPPFEDESVAPC